MESRIIQKFWDKVNTHSSNTKLCWEWTGAKNNAGYGNFWVDSYHSTTAHRVSYELVHGKIPDGMDIDHLCRNHGCVNPSHLELVTRQENLARGIRHLQRKPKYIGVECPSCHNKRMVRYWATQESYFTGYCKQCRGNCRRLPHLN